MKLSPDHEELPVRPPTPLEKVSDAGVVKGGENSGVTSSTDFVPDPPRAILW